MARSFSYDMENRQTTATVAGIGNTYKYDGEGRRVISNAWGQTTVHVYDAFGQLAASYGPDTATGTAYLTADALGSTRLIVPASTGPVQNFDYFPFGAEIPSGTAGRDSSFPAGYPVAPGGMPLKFTGKERDSETGLDYFGARYFSAAQGRFTSPDPMVHPQESQLGEEGFLSDPQRWNKYAYTRNNPLRYVDPDGRETQATLGDRETREAGYVIGNLAGGFAIGVANTFIKIDNTIRQGLNFLAGHYDQIPEIQTENSLQDFGSQVGMAVAIPGPKGEAGELVPGGEVPSAPSMRAAQRMGMREEGIPTSQQPTSQQNTPAGMQYTYEVPTPGGGTQTKIVQRNTGTDRSHPGQAHVEVGSPKPAGQTDRIGRPRLDNNKVKINVKKPNEN